MLDRGQIQAAGGEREEIDGVRAIPRPSSGSRGVRIDRGGTTGAFNGMDQQTYNNSGSDFDDGVSLDSTPRRTGTDGEMGSRSSSFTSPSTDGGGGGRRRQSSKDGGVGSQDNGSSSSSGAKKKTSASSDGARGTGSNSTSPAGDGGRGGSGNSSSSSTNVQSFPSVAAGGVPFGSSALSKALPNNGRGRPRGLRPRNSFGSSSGGGSRIPVAAPLSASSQSSGSRLSPLGGNHPPARHEDGRGGSAQDAQLEAAEIAAPGVPFEAAVQAAIKIESVMRVLIARGYVRRKLVSEVTAFSLIMERGIEVIKHPFSGKAKPKNVTVNFVSRKGVMQLSWGGKSGVPLETIFGVTKGIKTEALERVVGASERAENCFSLLTPDRTIDFEVDNPWLVLLVVRAMRLFLGAHYDTLPAPTFFSHLCVRPRGSGRIESPEQTMVWTDAEKSPAKEPASTPTERTSGDSASDDSDTGPSGRSSSGRERRAPWDGDEEEEEGGAGGGGDSDLGSAIVKESTVAPSGDASPLLPPPPAVQAPEAREEDEDFARDVFEEDGDEDSASRSPGGIMALFSSGRRSLDDMSSVGGGGSSNGGGSGEAGVEEGAEGQHPREDGPLTASQLLATRGMGKRLTLAKKMSAANAAGGVLKGKRFDLMALPADQAGQQERRERGFSEHVEAIPKRTQGMSISIGAGYDLPEEQKNKTDGVSHDPERMAVVDDLNNKLQSLRKLCVPQQRPGSYRPGRAPKTMAVKHMAFFQGAGGSVVGGGMGSVTDMWGDGVRRQYQTDMVRQKNQSVEDVRKRDDVKTAMLVNRSGVHRVTRKGAPS